MADQTQSAQGFAIPSGQEIYDQIMSVIEPELTTAQIPLLKEKYKSETPEEAQARSERYDKAFAEYDKRYAQYLVEFASKTTAFQHTMRRYVENESRGDEAHALQALESDMSTL